MFNNIEINRVDKNYILTNIGLFEIGKYYNYVFGYKKMNSGNEYFKFYHTKTNYAKNSDDYFKEIYENEVSFRYTSPTDEKEYSYYQFSWYYGNRLSLFPLEIKSRQFIRPTIAKLIGVTGQELIFQDYITNERLYINGNDGIEIEIPYENNVIGGWVPQVSESDVKFALSCDFEYTRNVYTNIIKGIKDYQNSNRLKEQQKKDDEIRLKKEFENYDPEIADILVKTKIKNKYPEN